MHIVQSLSDNMPAAAAAGTSFLTTLGVASQTVPLPPGTPPELALALSILGPVLVLIARQLLSARGAKKRARAELLEKRAAALRADADPSNDGEAARLEEEAVEEKAEADSLQNLAKK